MKYGLEGYGLFWILVEMLHENNGEMQYNPDILAFEYNCTEELVKGVVDLSFNVDDGMIVSERVKRNLEERLEKKTRKRDAGKLGAAARWNKDSEVNKGIAEVIQTHSKGIANVCDDDATVMQIDATAMQIDATAMQIDATAMQIDATAMRIDANGMRIDAIDKDKDKDKDKDILINKLKTIWKYEIENNNVKEENILNLKTKDVRENLNLFFEQVPSWESYLNKNGYDNLIKKLNKQNIQLDNQTICLIKTIQIL